MPLTICNTWLQDTRSTRPPRIGTGGPGGADTYARTAPGYVESCRGISAGHVKVTHRQRVAGTGMPLQQLTVEALYLSRQRWKTKGLDSFVPVGNQSPAVAAGL